MYRNGILAAVACLHGCMLGSAALAQSAPAPAKAKPALSAHAHGSAKLMVATDGNLLTLEFESPLDSLVGFEHAPRNEQQKAALRRMSETLQKADSLFVPTAAARCVLQSVKLESPVLDALSPRADAAKGKPPAKAAGSDKQAGHGAGDGHAELEGTIVFRCDQPGQLRDLEVRLFERFSGLKRLDTAVATAKGQKSVQLSAGTRRVAW
jgi:hypothetical protein